MLYFTSTFRATTVAIMVCSTVGGLLILFLLALAFCCIMRKRGWCQWWGDDERGKKKKKKKPKKVVPKTGEDTALYLIQISLGTQFPEAPCISTIIVFFNLHTNVCIYFFERVQHDTTKKELQANYGCHSR